MNLIVGKADENVINSLTATAKQKIEKDGILATRLCSHTKDADIINESKLQALEGIDRVVCYEMILTKTCYLLNLCIYKNYD